MDILTALNPQVSSVVSASAGTGKTWMLVSRILRLLLRGEEASSILAITYTDKAAVEMRERLMQRLLEMSFQVDVADDALREIGVAEADLAAYRERIPQLYESVLYSPYPIQVTTFHSFCRQIIKVFPLHTPVAQCEITSDTSKYVAQALDRVYAQASNEPQAQLARSLSVLLEECGGVINCQEILIRFLGIYTDWLAYLEDVAGRGTTPEKSLAELLGSAQDKAPSLASLWRDDFRKQLKEYATTVIEHGTPTQARYAQPALDLAEQTSLEQEGFEQLWDALFQRNGNARWLVLCKRIEKAEDEDYLAHFKELSSALTDTMRITKEKALRYSNLHFNKALYSVGAAALQAYQAVKMEDGVMDFNDLEWTARSILRKDANSGQQLQQRLNARIKHVLIDEFQDTNNNQWELLHPLMDEIGAQEDGSVFIVGDSKQSIYGFRGANPRLHKKALAWMESHPQGQHLTMQKSHRSAPEIIRFINHVFEHETIKQVAHLEDFESHETWRESRGGVTCLDLFVRDEKPEPQLWRNPLREPLPDPAKAMSKEAEHVAQRILALKQEQFVIEGRDGERAFAYSDVLILSRTAICFPYLQSALQRYAIPFAFNNDVNPFRSFEVGDICALLELLHDNQRNDLLARVLHSPIFSFSDEDLFALAKKSAGESWLATLAQHSKPHWQEAHRHIKHWSEQYGRLPTHDLLDMIYDQTDLIARYTKACDASRATTVRNNLSALLNEALTYHSGRYPDTLEFAHYIQEQEGSGYEAPEQGGHVRIMTVHSAKGLEAPVVFLVDTDRKPQRKKSYSFHASWSDAIGQHKAFMVYPKNEDCCQAAQEIKRQEREQEMKQETNLLYVAITRARQYLVVSGNKVRKQEKDEGKDVSKDKEKDKEKKSKNSKAANTTRDAATEESLSNPSWYQLLSLAFQNYSREKGAKPVALPFPPRSLSTEDERSASTGKLTGESVLLSKFPAQVTQTIRPHAVHADAQDIQDTAEPVEQSEGSGVLYGTIFHRTLELLCAEDGQEQDAIREQLDHEFSDDAETLALCWENALEVLSAESLHPLFDDERYSAIYNEMPLLYQTLDGDVVSGIIDRLCVSDEAVWIVDYKTHSLENRSVEDLAKSFEPQISLYVEGVKKVFPGKAVRASILFTANKTLYDYSL